MAVWSGLGQAATVAQLIGTDVPRLIYMVYKAVLTAEQNREECEQLARQVFIIAELLPHIQDPDVARQMSGLSGPLREAHELVLSCQGRSAVHQLVAAGKQAERFREVERKIGFYLTLFPVISYISITRDVNKILKVLVPDDSTRVQLTPIPESPSRLLQDAVQEILGDGTQKFMLAEIRAATNNFAHQRVIGAGSFGKVYRGTLQDGREVAVKRNLDQYLRSLPEYYHKERKILSGIRHENIIHLLGWCVSKKNKSCLTWWRKKPNKEERLLVFGYMKNGSLYQHLHPDQGCSSMSPVTLSWKVRIKVLVGVSRAIEHLHCHASPLIIHRDIKPANILLDASWVPRLSDFGNSHELGVNDSWLKIWLSADTLEPTYDISMTYSDPVMGTAGYVDPEYLVSGCLKLSSDIYSLGVVMLEVLSGKRPYSWSDGEELNVEVPESLIVFALSIMQAGTIGELLDKRPVPKPTPRQLEVLALVAKTASRCVQLEGKDRPAISDIVANLEKALELICPDELGSS